MMKKKVAWISSENFLDTDYPVVPSVNKEYDVFWYVIYYKNRVNDYNIDEVSEYAKKHSVKHYSIQFTYRLRSLKLISIYYRLIKKIKSEKPDIIYIDFLGIPYFFFLAYLFFNKRKVVYAAHDVLEHKNIKKRNFLKWYQYFIFKRFTNFHIFTKTQQKIFTQQFPDKKTFVASQYTKDFGRSGNIPADKITFLFFGIIRENKGLEILIKAANKLNERYIDRFKVIIAGSCENWDYYNSLIGSRKNLDLRIRMIGNDEIADLFSESNYIVLPYLDVTQSGPLLIAMNYNIPAIASDHPGFREYITHENNGYLFESGNIDELSGIMENIIDNNNVGYSQIKQNLAQFVVNNISLDAIVKEYSNFFSNI